MNTNVKTKSTELTPQQRIIILEDVLRKLENFDINGGLCYKIKCSAFELFQIQEDTNANEIIPLFTFENAKKVTDVEDGSHKEFYWWPYVDHYDLQNRIKMVKWMINEELTNKKEEIKTMDELRYSYDWLPLLRQYKKFDKVIELAEDAYMSDCRIMDNERLCTICLLLGNKVFSKIFFKSAYGRDIIEDFKNQIENLHRETNGRYIDDIQYVYFTTDPTFVCRFSSREEPIYEKFILPEYNKLFNTYYNSVKEAVENNPKVLFYEDDLE